MDFEITMRPTVDFFGYLMSRGSQLRILSPEWLAEQIHDLHRDAMRMYENRIATVQVSYIFLGFEHFNANYLSDLVR